MVKNKKATHKQEQKCTSYRVKHRYIKWWQNELRASGLTPNDEGVMMGNDVEYYAQDLGIPARKLRRRLTKIAVVAA